MKSTVIPQTSTGKYRNERPLPLKVTPYFIHLQDRKNTREAEFETEFLQKVDELFGANRNIKILDVGAGTGAAGEMVTFVCLNRFFFFERMILLVCLSACFIIP